MGTNTGKKQQDKPAPIALNLDTMEREGRQEVPYAFVLGGRPYELQDPHEMDYRELIAAMHAGEQQDFETAMGLLLPEEDRQEFFSKKISIWKLQPLFDGWVEHYGMPTAGEASASQDS